MPTYGATYKGVRFSEAYKQAAAIAPIGRAMLAAYELWHPTLADPIYFVDDRVDLVATIEGTADRNAGTEQTFIACLLSIKRPEESDTASSPSVELAREGVSGILKTALDTARGSLEPWELIERKYASDDTTGPATLGPNVFHIDNAALAAGAASITATYGDPANVSIPTRTFRREEYPTLDF
jgi:hypothetical protein